MAKWYLRRKFLFFLIKSGMTLIKATAEEKILQKELKSNQTKNQLLKATSHHPTPFLQYFSIFCK